MRECCAAFGYKNHDTSKQKEITLNKELLLTGEMCI